jgi:hypothetical protein
MIPAGSQTPSAPPRPPDRVNAELTAALRANCIMVAELREANTNIMAELAAMRTSIANLREIVVHISTELAAMRAASATHPTATDLMAALQALQRAAHGAGGNGWQQEPDGTWRWN